MLESFFFAHRLIDKWKMLNKNIDARDNFCLVKGLLGCIKP